MSTKMTATEIGRAMMKHLDGRDGAALLCDAQRMCEAALARWRENPTGVDIIPVLAFAGYAMLTAAKANPESGDTYERILLSLIQGAYQLGYEERRRDEIIELAERG